MLSPPTAHTSVSAPHDHILTSLLLAFRYLLGFSASFNQELREQKEGWYVRTTPPGT